jgi:UDP-N-acetylglucosamine 2-epimerase
MIDPIGHLDMLYAVRNAAFALTVTGGLQEETTAEGIRVLPVSLSAKKRSGR